MEHAPLFTCEFQRRTRSPTYNMTDFAPTPRTPVSKSFKITAMSECQVAGRVALNSTP